MSAADANEMLRYGRTAIVLHWVSAGIIIAMWPTAKFLMDEDDSLMLGIHMWLGMTIFALTIVRVAHHFSRPQPAPPPMPGWERVLFLANHYGLYIVLLVTAVSGIGAMLMSGEFPLPGASLDGEALAESAAGEFHETPANLLMLLFVMHLLGAVSYQVLRGRTLRRMGVPVGK